MMAGIPENAAWENEVYQIEQTDPVVGGPPDLGQGQGITNVPHQHLANRTAWLKAQIEALQTTLGGLSFATQTDIDAAIAALIGGAPGALDTLNELAAALSDDADFAATITAGLTSKLAQSANLGDLTSATNALTNLGITNTMRLHITGKGMTIIGDMGVVDNSIDDGPYRFSVANGSLGGPPGVAQGIAYHSRRNSGGGEVQTLITETGVGTGDFWVRARTVDAWSNWKNLAQIHDQTTWNTGTSTTPAMISPDNLAAAILAKFGAASAGVTYGAVGSYIFANCEADLAPGATVAGSALYPAGHFATAAATWGGANDSYYVHPDNTGMARDETAVLSGTWRCMGSATHANAGANRSSNTLFLRIF